MRVSVSEAKARLTDLVRRAEGGDEVILTRRGQPAVRLVPVDMESIRVRRLRVIDEVIEAARRRGPDGGPDAARSADWLYDENGLPA
ncbi:type II toxin-antitoxin system Phd/YefM family antitoxin [Sphingomonas sp.]|jgi:prevent-host-death family protein|uniref:type II toxin-antitoxin system Phd/YefM family antitoxin n=1 Tax=Sphingomonas sp. TaxID=28214 RepID=UPI0035C7C2AB